MCRGFENCKRAEFALVAALLTLVGVNTPPVFGGKDVSLSEVPQAVRATIERELKGVEIKVLNYKGQRPVRIKIEGSSGRIKANKGAELIDIGSLAAGKWLRFDIAVDTAMGIYDLRLNDKTVVSDTAFAEALTFADKPYESKFRAQTVERIEFRTGAYRLTDFSRYGSGDNGCLKSNGDLPGADEAVKNVIFDIDDFRTSGVKT